MFVFYIIYGVSPNFKLVLLDFSLSLGSNYDTPKQVYAMNYRLKSFKRDTYIG